MKNVFLPVLLVAAAVTGVWYLWMQTARTQTGFTTPDATTSEQPSTPAAKARTADLHQRSSTTRSAAATEESAVSQTEPVLMPHKTVATPAPPLYSPAKLENVKAGMAASSVTQLLGQPDLKTLTTDGGSLSETYFYAGKTYDEIGVVRLQDGRVMGHPARQ
jgi:cytoskeletal protein RodZ